MFYFESLKVETNSFNSPYSLTIQLEKAKSHFLTSEYTNWLKNIYSYMKDRKHYQSGTWLVDNYDLGSMNKSTFKNFLYENIAFCDIDLIVNNDWTINRIFNFYISFFNRSKKDLAIILKTTQISNEILNEKIKNLNYLDYVKLLIALSLFKKSNYMIVNLLDFKLNESDVKIINEIYSSLINNHNKTIISFVNNNVFHPINLESKDYFKYNKMFTIGERNYHLNEKSFKSKIKIFTSVFKIVPFELFCFFITNLFFNFASIFIFCLLSLNLQNRAIEDVVNFVHNNNIWMTILGYLSYLLSYLNISFWWFIMRKKIKRYELFLIGTSANRFLMGFAWPTIIELITILTLIISFTSSEIFTTSQKITTHYLWFALPLFLYMIYFVIINIALSFKINDSIRQVTIKETLIKIVSS